MINKLCGRLGLTSYLFRILFPRSLKTLDLIVFVNVMHFLPHFEVLMERGNDIRISYFSIPGS